MHGDDFLLVSGVLTDVLSQVAHGLAFLHSKWHIAHLDVKPENLYTTDRGIYKLGDLGLASLGDRYTTDVMPVFCISHGY